MPSSWLDHRKLQIVKGIGKTPTDTYSAEADPVIVNLMSGPITLESNGWSPQIAPSDTVWADSPLADGRTLLAASAKNVTEKMSLLIVDKSNLGMMKALDGLNKMVADCRNFWQSQYQIDPVYLLWYAGCGAGEQYALISNMDVSTDYLDSPDPAIRVSLSIEREPYWRGIPPGANPKLWTFYVNGQQIGTNKTLADASLFTGTDHLVSQTIQNKFEWTPTADGLQLVPISKNYIDIPAALVPGDAPALVEVNFSVGSPINKAFVGLSSHKISGTNHAAVSKANSYVLAAGDGTVLNGAVKNVGTSSTGVISNNSSSAFINVSKALLAANTTYVPYLSWGIDASGGGATDILELDRHFYAGSFAVFLRAVGVTEDTTQLARITFGEIEDKTFAGYKQTVQLTDIPITTNSLGGYNIIYCGAVTLPLSGREAVALNGFGTMIRETVGQLYVSLELKNSAGATRTPIILDLILMPIDHFMNEIVTGINSSSGNAVVTVDSTGYLAHGEPDARAVNNASALTTSGVTAQLLGQDPFLIPKIDQRLYFLVSTGFTEQSLPTNSIAVRLNIVPRWASIRDV